MSGDPRRHNGGPLVGFECSPQRSVRFGRPCCGQGSDHGHCDQSHRERENCLRPGALRSASPDAAGFNRLQITRQCKYQLIVFFPFQQTHLLRRFDYIARPLRKVGYSGDHPNDDFNLALLHPSDSMDKSCVGCGSGAPICIATNERRSR